MYAHNQLVICQPKYSTCVNGPISMGSSVVLAVLLMTTTVTAEEVISRAWTVQNVPEPTFTATISRANTIQNVLQPTFNEAISSAVTQCNTGIFVDQDGDSVHDCFDVCLGGDDLIDNDGNDIPDECELGSCCLMTGGFPGCFNSNKLECESPPINGTYGGEGSVCDQNVAIIYEEDGTIFIHAVGPPATCNTGNLRPAHVETASARAGITPPPTLDVWRTAGALAHSFSLNNGGTPIPAGFFAPGSDPFTGALSLQSQPLMDPQYPGADTLIRRHGDPFDVCSPGPYPQNADPVEIEIIALSLANPSSAPITVTFGGTNPQLWDVTVSLAGPAPMGALTATKEHCNGGTFTSTLNVWPAFTFRRRSDGLLRGLVPPTYSTFVQDQAGAWVHEVSPVYDAEIDVTSEFHAGFEMRYSPLVCGVDTDGDAIRLECDNCAEIANPLQENADADLYGDVCDNCPQLANDDQADSDLDLVGNACDNCPAVVNPLQEDADSDNIGDHCDPPEALAMDTAGGPTVRFLPLVVPESSIGDNTALRVELAELSPHRVCCASGDPDSCNSITCTTSAHCTQPGFTSCTQRLLPFEGQHRYVNTLPGGSTTCEDSATFGTSYRCAVLGCEPEYRDWATDLGGATLNLAADAIAPSGTYRISHLAEICGPASSADTCAAASAPIAVATARWGDVGSGGGGVADGATNVIDIGLVVDNVKGLAGALPERRCWLKQQNPEPQSSSVNVIDIGLAVDAVKGLPYPYSMAACP